MRHAVLALALLVSLSAPALAGDGWFTDFEQAKTKAKAEDKLILADFTGSDWCYWCKRLDQEVFKTAEFKAWAKDTVVCLKVDFPAKTKLPPALEAQNAKLQKQYKIEGYPTIVFMDAEGKEIGRYGYDKGGPVAWIKKAKEIIAQGQKPAAASAPEADGWLTDFEQAKTQAKSGGKAILADFTGSDWCYWCKRLKREVFEQAAFKTWAKDAVVLLEVDFPRKDDRSAALKAQNAALQKQFKIEGYPTVVFMDAGGKELGRLGYERGGAEHWVKRAQEILSRAK